MKFITRSFTVVGFLVVLFAMSGAIGVGHFRLYYGPVPVVCEPSHAKE